VAGVGTLNLKKGTNSIVPETNTVGALSTDVSMYVLGIFLLAPRVHTYSTS